MMNKDSHPAHHNHDHVSKHVPGGRLTCDVCRERKVRCDRAYPKCGRCTRLGYDCSYRGRKTYKSVQADLPRQLSELQTRLAQAEAMLRPLKPNVQQSATPEHVYHQGYPSSLQTQQVDHATNLANVSPMLSNPPDPDGFDLLANLADESQESWNGITADWFGLTTFSKMNIDHDSAMSQSSADSYGTLPGSQMNFVNGVLRPPPDFLASEEVSIVDMNAMLNAFFDTFNYVMPILNSTRVFSEWTNTPNRTSIRALTYALALIATTFSSNFSHLEQICYHKARTYVELCEREEDEDSLAGLNLIQAIIFLTRYEITKVSVRKSCLMLGRAVTLARIMNLQRMDSEENQKAREATEQDDEELEEKRRCFWALYVLDCYAAIRMEKPLIFIESQIQVFLPSPDDLTSSTESSPKALLGEISEHHSLPRISSFLGIILMVRLERLCFEHLSTPSNNGFWDRHYGFVKALNECTTTVQMHLSADAIRRDPLALTLYLNLCGTYILLHEAAISKVDEQELPRLIATESRKCSVAAAFKVANAVRLVWPRQRTQRDFCTIQSVFLSWPIVMGLNALSRHFSEAASATEISNNIFESSQILRSALDQIEAPEGHWHTATATARAAMDKWAERHGK